MIGQGIHYAVTPGQMAALLEAAPRGDEAVLDALNEIEGVGDRKTRGGKGAGLIAQPTDRAWELIHRLLPSLGSWSTVTAVIRPPLIVTWTCTGPYRMSSVAPA